MWTLLLFLSLSTLTTAQDPFKNEVTLSVTNQSTFSFKIQKRPVIKDGSKCVITTRLEQGQNVNMVVLYGRQSESWILDSPRDNTTTTLCHEGSSADFDTLHFTLYSFDGQPSIVKLSAKWEDIALRLGESKKTMVISIIFRKFLLSLKCKQSIKF